MRSISLHLFRAGKGLFFRTEMDRLLATSMFFGCVMVLLRVLHTGSYIYMSMIWNLFLGYIPYVLSNWLSVWPGLARGGTEGQQPGSGGRRRWSRDGQRPGGGDGQRSGGDRRRWSRVSGWPADWPSRVKQLLRLVLFMVWLLFIPNSFYMLTDLFHLSDNHRNILVPMWFDLVLILSFAWSGLLLGVLSVRQMERIFLPRASVLGSWLFVSPIMALNALGVYIGRYLRYNSWDIIINPVDLLKDIIGMIIHPFRNHYAWDMILCFSILLTLIYRMIKRGGLALA